MVMAGDEAGDGLGMRVGDGLGMRLVMAWE